MPPIHISVVAAFLLSGFWNAGTPLETASTPDSATAPDEKARSSMNRPSVPCCCLSSLASSLSNESGIGPTCCTKMRYSPVPMRSNQHDDVEVRRPGERGAALLHATQVHHRHHGHAQQTDRYGPLVVEAGGCSNRQHAAGDADRHGEDVVDEQR